MAERQQTPPDFTCMSLDKIIEAMTADLENSRGHYAHFGLPQAMPPNLDTYSRQHDRNYLTTSMRNQTVHQNTSGMNSIPQQIYMPDVPPSYNPNDAGEQMYLPPQTVNHLGINENNDLIGTIDVGGGNYINVIYAKASQLVAEQCGVNNMATYNNHQGVIDREYGLFNEERMPIQHNNVSHHQNRNGKQLIDDLVGNWVPNQSGTYSPFGSSLNVTSSTNVNGDIRDIKEQKVEVPKVIPEVPQQKKRIVAEVKPMRPSYSAVLTKLPPPPSTLINSPPTKVQPDTNMKKASGKNSKNKNKPGLLKRQNSSGSDEHGSPKIQLLKKSSIANNTNLSRRWVSLDNLDVKSEANDINTFNRAEQFEKRKSTKTSKKNEMLNNTKIQNGNAKSSANVQKRPIQINNNLNNSAGINQIPMTERIEKTQQANNRNNRDDKKIIKEKNIKRSHAEKTQQIKKGQKNRKRDNKDSPMKDLLKNVNKYVTRWSKIGLQIFYWLLHLISDVVSMSTNLVIQFVKCIWFLSILYTKYSWDYVITAFSKIRFLNAMGKKIDSWFGNSRFAFWRRLKKPKLEKDDNTNWIQGGLEINIALPSTGEEAMKRLLACKGKDPYSILGVTPTCSDDDIKKYYKRQAFLVHPDKNNQPGAEEAFKILVHAFNIIDEPGRRQAFDQTRQVEAAWGELSDLLSQLHRKMEQAANTIRCTNCGAKHKRIPTPRPCYAARFCSQCKIRHSAKEGDIWAESRIMGFLWHYYACMEGTVYDVTDWAACQAGNLKHLRANTHGVQYRIVLGQRSTTQTSSTSSGNKKRQTAENTTPDAELEDFLNTFYNNTKPGTSTASTTTTTEQATTKNDGRRRKTRRK